MKYRLGLLGLCFLLMAGMSGLPAQAQTKKPNVIFILTDDMGYGDIGSYGVRDIRTPHLDRLAHQGVRLTNAYANGPVCTPTRAAFMTGRYQQRVGLEWVLREVDRDRGLPVSEISLARMLKNNGYATALFGKWHLGFRPEFGPNAHGFDEFFGILSGAADHYSHRTLGGQPDLWENTDPVERKGYLTDLLTGRAVDFINRHLHDPFFLEVAYTAPHWPFQAPDNPDDIRNAETFFDGTRQDYARMVERVDEGVGQILHVLDRHGLANDTLVIFTNDNGGERLSRNEPFFHQKSTLWEGGLRVPCILHWPGQLPARTVSDQPAITMDLTATILAATGTPPARTLDGINLLPILQGKNPPLPRTFFWRIYGPDRIQQAARAGDWKYVFDGGGTPQEIRQLLFDLEQDLAERHNRAYQHPEVVRELRDLLAGWEKEVAPVRSPRSAQ